MVRKITSGEYLKRYDNMTAQEQSDYLGRVGGWLANGGRSLTARGEVFEARLQNVIQVSIGWNDEECRTFEEGAVLLSALVGVEDTKLPDLLYSISAKRSIRRIEEALSKLIDHSDTGMKEEPAAGKSAIKREQNGTGSNSAEREQARPEVNRTQAVVPFRESAGNGAVGGRNNEGEAQVKPEWKLGGKPDGKASGTATAIPARPTHIDQYVHLLPEKTQERAALVQGLYREMDEARRKAELLIEDPTAKSDDIAAWARTATACDNKLHKILKELDDEWKKLVKSGRVVVDDLGNVRVIPIDNGQWAINNEAAAIQEAEELTSEQRARRRELRKWLTDTRRGNGNARDARVEKWYENFREYLALEGDKAFEDEKIKEAIGHYGIDVKDERLKIEK